jgi:hypothetical protein
MRIYNKIDITLAITHFRIGYCIKQRSILFLYNRQRPDRLAKQLKITYMNGNFTCESFEYMSPYSDNISNVEKSLENGL